ncbi:MAG: ribosome small subunit-dependent GTPase A [Nannocystaceae bacterium]
MKNNNSPLPSHGETSSQPRTLDALGFTASEAKQLAALDPHVRPARVARVDGPIAHVLDPGGEHLAALPGRLRGDPERAPVVGDWVTLRDAPHGEVVVVDVLDRRTRIARAAAGARARVQVIAANVDRVFVVMGLDGDFNPRRLERYLTICGDAGTDALILLTKAAACADVEAKLAACRRVTGAPFLLGIHAIDVVDGVAPEVPRGYLAPGLTIALVGSSGAGKSTLLNHLLGGARMSTAAVRARDDRGQHTTTHRELALCPGGGLLIDNPGMRELALWLDGDGLRRAFADVDELAHACRFRDCTHEHEPGCAVRQAVEDGAFDEDRLASFGRLQREVEATERRRDERRRRADDRRQGKLFRQIQRDRQRRRGDH